MAYGGWTWWRVRQDTIARSQAISNDAVGPPLTEFELTERSGEPFRSTDMKGKVWVVSYFFTTCPGNCIRVNTNIQRMHNLPDLRDVTWVSITCDPDTDTIDALSEYANTWKADPHRWLFCRGDLNYVKRIARGMSLYLSLKGHQDHVAVIDKYGKIRGMFDAMSAQDCERMHTLLLKCLAEKGPNNLAAAAPKDEKPS
jgi:cytochrome oxidase Cu insertion factor (SCO1/SenC/PrrC family)